jgi:hypothetical protein
LLVALHRAVERSRGCINSLGELFQRRGNGCDIVCKPGAAGSRRSVCDFAADLTLFNR